MINKISFKSINNKVKKKIKIVYLLPLLIAQNEETCMTSLHTEVLYVAVQSPSRV